MSEVTRSVWSAVCVAFLTGGGCQDTQAESLKSPSLSEVVFMGLRPAKELNPVSEPKERQECIRKYLDAIAPNSYLWSFEISPSPDQAVHVRRRVLAEQMIAILGPDVRNEAEAFAYEVPLIAEWEGMSEGPVQEADFADNWLRKRPGTSIAPFLYLFRAHRLRVGYEAVAKGHEEDLRLRLARRYREALAKARSSTNPLISCIADDLEAQAYVYLEGRGRP